MANYVIYTRSDKSEVKLRLDAGRTEELEEHIGGSIQKKLPETDRMSVAVEFVAAAVPEGEYAERRKTALAIYDEMVEAGQKYSDYLGLIHRILTSAGFMDGGTVERQMEVQKAAEKLEELAYQVQIEQIRMKTAELEAQRITDVPADTEAIQS